MIALCVASFLTGLMGSAHCFFMCSPVLSVIGMNTYFSKIKSAVFYNFGRLSTYLILTLLLSILTLGISDLKTIQVIFRYLAAIIMIVVALQLMGFRNYFPLAEKAGTLLWKPISKYAGSFFPIKNSQSAYLTGIIWGFLPCGMVYSVLLQSLSLNNLSERLLLVFCFGLGTLPSMFSMSIFSNILGNYLQKPNVRRVAGIFMLLLVAFYIFNTSQSNHKTHHKASHSSQNQGINLESGGKI